MARYGTETRLKPEEVIERAEAYSGEKGLGLEITEKDPCCIYLVGGGGHVFITATAGAQDQSRSGNPGVGLPHAKVHGRDPSLTRRLLCNWVSSAKAL